MITLFVLLVTVNIFKLLLILCVIGVGLWLINTKVPMPAWLKLVINLVVAAVILWWLFNVFGIDGNVTM